MIVGARSIADLQDFKKLNPGLRALGLVPGLESGPPGPAAIEEFARAGADIIRLWPHWIFTSRDQASGQGGHHWWSGCTTSVSQHGPLSIPSTVTSARSALART